MDQLRNCVNLAPLLQWGGAAAVLAFPAWRFHAPFAPFGRVAGWLGLRLEDVGSASARGVVRLLLHDPLLV